MGHRLQTSLALSFMAAFASEAGAADFAVRLGGGLTGPAHPFQRWGCDTRRGCRFTRWGDSTAAQTLKATAALEGRLPLRGVTPFAGVDAGGILYTWERRKDIRALWGLRAGLIVPIAGQNIVAAARRSTVTNPPFGYETFHPWELTLGVELGL